MARLRIQHTSRYEYDSPVHASYNETRISPLDTAQQFTLEHRVEVQPATNLFRYRDYWGTRVHAFDLHHEHTELSVVGTSVVETSERTPSPDDRVGWDAIDAPGLIERFFEYLAPTAMTAPVESMTSAAAALRAQTRPADALQTLSAWLRDTVRYRTGTTSVSTTAAEVLRAGEGVCQDFVHLGLGVLRSAGIPARYSSGYLYPDVDDTRETTEAQSHAWLEAWVGDWFPLDPTSGDPVAERHVLVARGRDYADVAPIKGIYHGGSGHKLAVAVKITSLD